ncbi:MAG: molybdopterin cofactor-binding domain-containing protein [Candidatus Hodarchaeales archaeon]|jgi:xanthine dehydrogenase large subunit
MKNIDSYSHVRGESIYVDDIPVQEGTLYGVALGSPIAKAQLTGIDTSEAFIEGVKAILTSKDIPGKNQIGGILEDEELFVDKQISFIGQPIALIVAESEFIAREARRKISITYEEEIPILDPREAKEKGEFIVPPRTLLLGDTEKAFEQCDLIIEGKADSGGQEHLYIETQGSYVIPIENGGLKVFSSTQSVSLIQKTIAKVLDLPMHKVEVDTRRLGGAFGGKEDQATAWACMASLATFLLRIPVKVILHRFDDINMTGKRHPYTSDFKIGLLKEGKIIAYEVEFYQDAGAKSDLSPAILGRTLFHTQNSYAIPNIKTTAYSCRTNTLPNTAFRGFGGPQGMFVIESAIAKAAEMLGIDACEIQKKNLISNGDLFVYKQEANDTQAKSTWEEAEKLYNKEEIIASINEYNTNNHYLKKGLAFMPVCFGISFNKISMNKAASLVHVYQDGSVSVSTGAVEMGQGVNTRILQVPAEIFSIKPERVKVETTNTTRVANVSPTAASVGADMNGKATEQACNKILDRLKEVAAKELKETNIDLITFDNEKVCYNNVPTALTWDNLLSIALENRVDLSAHGYYATPTLTYNPEAERNIAFAYHAYGTAITVVTVDCLRGNCEIDGVYVVHDYGKPWNPVIDLGQTEGGIVQGIGWMTSEEVMYDEKGRLISNALSTYKVPDVYAVPKEIKVKFLERTEEEKLGLMGSKAVGEPPLMYGIGTYFAIRNAIKVFNPAYDMPYEAPMTPERVLFGLYGKIDLEPKKEESTNNEKIVQSID